MDIYLLNFNNYYNRQVKLYGLLSNYTEFLCKGNTYGNNPINGVNFNPGNGIDSAQVINWDGENPDYILAADGSEIISRWYVIQSERLRNGQFRLVLYRDLVADYYEEVMRAPMFIEKGYVSIDDPAIFNEENMTFNRIKVSEQALKDKTNTAWIVGYCNTGEQKSVQYGGIPSVDFEVESLEDWTYTNFVDVDTTFINKNSLYLGITTKFYGTEGQDQGSGTVVFNQHNFKKVIKPAIKDIVPRAIQTLGANYDSLSFYRASEDTMQTALTQIGYYNNPQETNVGNITRLNNKRIRVGTGDNTQYYNIKVTHTEKAIEASIPYESNTGNKLTELVKQGAWVNNRYFQILEWVGDTLGGPAYWALYDTDTVKIELKPYSFSEGFTTTLRADRPLLNDAPYCMFCMPYGEYQFKDSRGTHDVSTLNSFSLAVGIATALGGSGTSGLYDLQLLPYCPIPLVREYGPVVDLTDSGLTDNIIYDVQTDSDTLIFWAKESTGSFNITYNFYTNTLSPVMFKVRNQTRKWRLCSPNYNGIFEFNPFKNGGTTAINVDYTYKPHQPYIHLNPDFGGLYGKDFNDARGLICGGDFSLPIIDNAWIDYQISNKNFNEIFNRQIESLELQQDIASTQDIINAITGTLSGTVSGASAGFMSGAGGWGAVIGGVVGLGASGYAGAKDIEFNQRLRDDAKDLTHDMFNFNNQNIQALPNSLTRVSAYNANNKIFPFIERYEATEQEEKALESKITYNGMTIGRIGALEDYIINKPALEWGYFKGQIIRLEDLGDDFLVANTLANELNKGVYIL